METRRLDASVRVEQRSQRIDDIFVFAVPRKLLLPVDAVVLLIKLLVTRHYGVLFVAGVDQQGIGDRVAYPVDELLVLAVRDLCLVHPESLYCSHELVVVLAEHCVLGVSTHFERAFLDEHHPIGIRFLKITVLTDANKLTGRLVAACECDCTCNDWQNLRQFHMSFFMLCYALQLMQHDLFVRYK